jgi:CRP/FNR family transcriptional regulator
MKQALKLDISTGESHGSHICGQCDVRHRAMCAAVEFERLGTLEAIVSHRRYRPGQTIFEEGEAADYVYNLSGGDVRLYKLLIDGRRQIMGFLRPGDFLGLIKQNAYCYGAEAVNNVELCCIRVIDIERLMIEMPVVRDRLLDMGRDELMAAQEQMLLLGRKSAKEKLLSFLLLRLRQEGTGDQRSATLDLPMTRYDIADYLGLTVETVSRNFTELRTEGLIKLPTVQHVIFPNLKAVERAASTDI